MSSHYGFDLLQFLDDVSHQVETLLNHDYHRTTVEGSIEDAELQIDVQDSIDNFPSYIQPSQSMNRVDSQHQARVAQYQQPISTMAVNIPTHNWNFNMNEDQNYTGHARAPHQLVSQADYIAAAQATHHHHYVPPSSTNFVNISQYSAKPSQRQVTGYAYCGENPIVESAVPQPPDYQSECAYCCWLATSPSLSAVPVGPVIVASSDHFDTSNYAYHNG